MGEIIYFIDGCPGRRRLSSGGQRPVGRIFANDNLSLSLLHRSCMKHTYIHTYTHTYIHTYINTHTFIIPSIALDCSSHFNTWRERDTPSFAKPVTKKSGRDDIMHYAQNLDIQQRSLHSTEQTLSKTKTTYIHDTS